MAADCCRWTGSLTLDQYIFLPLLPSRLVSTVGFSFFSVNVSVIFFVAADATARRDFLVGA